MVFSSYATLAIHSYELLQSLGRFQRFSLPLNLAETYWTSSTQI